MAESPKRNVHKELDNVTEHWFPRVIADANGQSVKVAKIKGNLTWHSHKDEDEVFFILKGKPCCWTSIQDAQTRFEFTWTSNPLKPGHCGLNLCYHQHPLLPSALCPVGSVVIEYRDRPNVELNEGDIHTVPMGVEHNPVAAEECWLMLFEPMATKHTGDTVSPLTRTVEEQRGILAPRQ
jgi:mannose-6-phosphate isomerase-like protein (cupin superfamily)